jgi:hypothetical protein
MILALSFTNFRLVFHSLLQHSFLKGGTFQNPSFYQKLNISLSNCDRKMQRTEDYK